MDAKKPTNKWIKALRLYHDKHGGKYTVPKKGTTAYDEVKKIMAGLDSKK